MDHDALAAMLADHQEHYTRWSGPSGSIGALFQRQNRMIRLLLAQPGDYAIPPGVLANHSALAEPAAPAQAADGAALTDSFLAWWRARETGDVDFHTVDAAYAAGWNAALAAPRPAAVTEAMVELACAIFYGEGHRCLPRQRARRHHRASARSRAAHQGRRPGGKGEVGR